MLLSFQMAATANFPTIFIQHRQTTIRNHTKFITKKRKCTDGGETFGNVPSIVGKFCATPINTL